MTATPIPRTAAMVIFGDLDLTTLDELPPGRVPVTTEWLPGEGHAGRGPAWERVRERGGGGSPRLRGVPARLRVAAGRGQVGHRGVRAAGGGGAGRPASRAPARPDGRGGARGGHGPLPYGRLEVLVATTVIEVGVDVPEATVMVVESADRFGIAQLHQLRGRVGRGTAASWCYLLGGEEGNERLAAVAASTRTGSLWPRRTCACAARARCWARARRGRAT